MFRLVVKVKMCACEVWNCRRRPPIWTLLRHMTEDVLPGYLIGIRFLYMYLISFFTMSSLTMYYSNYLEH